MKISGGMFSNKAVDELRSLLIDARKDGLIQKESLKSYKYLSLQLCFKI